MPKKTRKRMRETEDVIVPILQKKVKSAEKKVLVDAPVKVGKNSITTNSKVNENPATPKEIQAIGKVDNGGAIRSKTKLDGISPVLSNTKKDGLKLKQSPTKVVVPGQNSKFVNKSSRNLRKNETELKYQSVLRSNNGVEHEKKVNAPKLNKTSEPSKLKISRPANATAPSIPKSTVSLQTAVERMGKQQKDDSDSEDSDAPKKPTPVISTFKPKQADSSDDESTPSRKLKKGAKAKPAATVAIKTTAIKEIPTKPKEVTSSVGKKSFTISKPATQKTSVALNTAHLAKESDSEDEVGNQLDRFKAIPSKSVATQPSWRVTKAVNGSSKENETKKKRKISTSNTPSGETLGKNLEDAVRVMETKMQDPIVHELHSDRYDSSSISKAGRAYFMNMLIDSAAGEQWNLGEMGRLIRLFCMQWQCKRKKTSRFLRQNCSEFVCAEFLEGLGIQLKVSQLVKIIQRGSQTLPVVANKLSACIDSDIVRISDSNFLASIASLVNLASHTTDEIAEFLAPIIESANKMEDACKLLHYVCEHWPIEIMQPFVQRVLLLNPVFDDLEGDPAEISTYFPNCAFDLPNRMLRDLEDMDQNGNLVDFCVGETEADIEYEQRSSADELDALEDRITKNSSTKKRGGVVKKRVVEVEVESDDETDLSDSEVSATENLIESDEEDVTWGQGAPKKPRRNPFILDEASEEEDYESSDDEVEEEE